MTAPATPPGRDGGAAGARSVPLRRALELSFTAIVLALAAALLFLALVDRRRSRDEVARTVLDQSLERAHGELRELFAPVQRQVAIDWYEVQLGQVPRYDAERHMRHFLPPLLQLPSVSSMMVADTAGHQLLLMRYDSSVIASPLLEGRTDLPPAPTGVQQFFTRDFRPAVRRDRSLWQLWRRGDSVAPSWEVRLPGYDPTQRAWFRQAMAHFRAGAGDDLASAIAWSDVYTLFTTRQPGMSVSFAVRDTTGELVIVAYDILLAEVSRYTRAQRPTPRSRVFVVSDSGWLIGLPHDARFADRAQREAFTLVPIERLGIAELDAWGAHWRARGAASTHLGPVDVDGERWWIGYRAFDLSPGRRFWVGVALPQSDAQAALGPEGTGILGATAIALLLALAIASRLARRVSDPLAALAGQSARIARLDLAPAPPTGSRLTEVRQLDEAIEAMRRALEENLAERERAAAALQESKARLLQAQKLDAVGQLAGGVAHDFNNLLTAIRGYTELLRERLTGDPGGLEDLGEIDAAALRATDLTRQLLAFSRRQHAEPRVIDVNRVVTSASRMLGRLMGERITLETALAEPLPAVRIDPSQLHQVLVNLAVNARDAMPAGGRVTITTSSGGRIREPEALAPSAPGLAPVIISVVDTGEGMPPEVRARAFEPFFTTKEQGHGTGLGLATCWGIVRDAGGTIEIDSEPRAGTVVRVILPAVAERPEPEPGDRTGAPPASPIATVLVVEDESQLRALAERALQRVGFHVLTASDGVAALELLGARRDIDLVLTDVVMPRLGGPGLARRIRAEWPSARIVFMTGYADADAFGDDADAVRDIPVLRKPFTPAELARAVREALEARPPGRS